MSKCVGVGFRVSSAVHNLKNYLWNCCIHLNRNLPEWRWGVASPHHAVGSISSCPPLPVFIHTPFLIPISPIASVCLIPNPLSLPSHDDGLSIMQIYNHFICWCLPLAGCRNIAKIMHPRCPLSCSQHHCPPLNLSGSQISRWRLMLLWVPAGFSCILYVCVCWATAEWDPVLIETMLKEVPATPVWLFRSAHCVVMDSQSTGRSGLSVRCISQHCHISPFWMEGQKKAKGKKKGASFSPYRLGEAMLCPCNCVGISSINSATLDNKYRATRQVLRDQTRGYVNEWCICVCACVALLCAYVCVEKNP